MEVIDTLRKWTRRAVGKALGVNPDHPHLWAAQQKTDKKGADINALPVDASHWQPLQNSQGQAYFMAGYDDPNNTANHPLR